MNVSIHVPRRHNYTRENYSDKIQGRQINAVSIDKVEQLQVRVENVFFIFGRGSRLSQARLGLRTCVGGWEPFGLYFQTL